MVSFTCNRCQDVVKKPKVLPHAQSCGTTHYSCVDCMEVFDLDAVRGHNTCITEEDKYQGRWKQKTNNFSGGKRKGGPIVDSDGEDEEAKQKAEKALLMQRVRPCAKNFLASSDDSDSDDECWLEASRKKKADKNAKKKKAPQPSSDDDDEDDKKGSAKEAEKASRRSASRSPRRSGGGAGGKRARSEDATGGKTAAAAAAAGSGDSGNDSAEAAAKKPRHTPLLLPTSTAEMDGTVTVDAFALGSTEEVVEIIHSVLANSGEAASAAQKKQLAKGGAAARVMREKDVAKLVAECYRNRLAKHLRAAIRAAVAGSAGALHMDDDGNIIG